MACGRCFLGKKKTKLSWIKKAYEDYTIHKQTYKELSEKYGKSHKTLRKYFDKYAGATGELTEENRPIVLIMDATFFGRGYGILLGRSVKRPLMWQEISTETVEVYESFLRDLKAAGYLFSGFVIDGRRGVRQLLELMFPGTPIQFCQFHQIQIVKRYLPKKAKTEAALGLRRIGMNITKTNESELIEALDMWHEKHGDFMKEKTYSKDSNQWRYTHGRLRSAYESLKRNLPYLFIYQNHPQLNIPNTTNHCDGLFAHIKQKVLIHRGISKKRRKQMIDYLFENF